MATRRTGPACLWSAYHAERPHEPRRAPGILAVGCVERRPRDSASAAGVSASFLWDQGPGHLVVAVPRRKHDESNPVNGSSMSARAKLIRQQSSEQGVGRISEPAPLVSVSELEAHLWESTNILRGPIDQADFKSYVFPLLFLKRISDVYDEEYQEALDQSDGDVDYASFAENHRFQVPDGAHWDDLRVLCASRRARQAGNIASQRSGIPPRPLTRSF